MAGPSIVPPRRRVTKFKPSALNSKRVSAHKKTKTKAPKEGEKRTRKGTMKPSLLESGYTSLVPAGRTDPRQMVYSSLKKFDELRPSVPKDGQSFRVLKLMRRNFPRFILNATHREGSTPGVEVGDYFCTRAELFVVGLHRQAQGGIDWIEFFREDGNTTTKAVSIVVSEVYEDNQDNGETLFYTGAGGNDLRRSKKQCENQKLKRGTEALYNSKILQNSVRVIRRHKDKRSVSGLFYSYDGLYKVEEKMKVKGKSGFDVFKFKLVREPGQKPLIWAPPPVEYRPHSETFVRDLREEHEEPAQPSQAGLTAFLGRTQRQISDAVPKGAEGDVKGDQSVDNGEGKGHRFHRGLKRKVEEDLSGAAAQPVSSLEDGKSEEIEEGIKRRKVGATGTLEGASNSSADAKGPVVGVKLSTEFGHGDEDGNWEEDEPIIFPRSKVLKDRAKGESLFTNFKLQVDDLEEVLSTREDLYGAKQKVFKGVKKDEYGHEDEDEDQPLEVQAREEPSVTNIKLQVKNLVEEQSSDFGTGKDLHVPKQGARDTITRKTTSAKKWRSTQLTLNEGDVAIMEGETIVMEKIKEKNKTIEAMWNKSMQKGTPKSNVASESEVDYSSNSDASESEESDLCDSHEESDGREIENDVYVVDQILQKRIRKNVVEYLVLWEGYSRDEATWEPRENLDNCDEALAQFELLSNRRGRVNFPFAFLSICFVILAGGVEDIVNSYLPPTGPFTPGGE
ncbi:unnamed protein product [Calypogeia fissa]